jgi:hypothetical protein
MRREVTAMKNDMKKLIIQLSNERLITPSGLLVGALLGKSDLVNYANRFSGKFNIYRKNNGVCIVSNCFA